MVARCWGFYCIYSNMYHCSNLVGLWCDFTVYIIICIIVVTCVGLWCDSWSDEIL